MILNCIHLVAKGRVSFFFVAKGYSIMCKYHICLMQPTADGRPGGSHILPIVDGAVINMAVRGTLLSCTTITEGKVESGREAQPYSSRSLPPGGRLESRDSPGAP